MTAMRSDTLAPANLTLASTPTASAIEVERVDMAGPSLHADCIAIHGAATVLLGNARGRKQD